MNRDDTNIAYPPPTIETFRDPTGRHVFNEERRALHDRIIERFFTEAEKHQEVLRRTREANKKREIAKRARANGQVISTKDVRIEQPSIPIDEQPVLFVIGGGPGSGKTTLTKWLRNKGVLDGSFITLTLGTFSDLPEFKQIAQATKHPHPEKSPTLVAEYYYLRQRIFEECVKRGMSLVVDEHMDHPEEDKKLLDAADKAGYLKVLVGMTITPVHYFNDVRSLIEQKGIDHRHTPWALGIHKQFAQRWEELAKDFDVSFLYQKNHSRNYPVALVADEDNMISPVQHHEIIDQRRYEIFKKWREVNLQATCIEEAFPRQGAESAKDFFDRMGKDTHTGADGRGLYPRKRGRGWDEDARSFLERVKSAAQDAIVRRE